MVQKSKGRKIYRTMQGKQVDLDLLIKRNEHVPAVGNAKVNARGDELGPGGKIIRKREEVVQDYYKKNKPVADEVVLKQSKTQPIADDIAEMEQLDNETVPEKPSTSNKRTTSQKKQTWIEDSNGNFKPKDNK